MSGLDLLVLVLATWRSAHLLVKEDGPFEIFVRLRHFVGIEQIVVQGKNGPLVGVTTRNMLAEGLTCLWCVSIWTGAFFVIGWQLPWAHNIVCWLAYLLTLSAGATLVQTLVERFRDE